MKLVRITADNMHKLAEHVIMRMRTPAWEILREAERGRGFSVVEPGSVPWLPLEDWHSTSCVSRDGQEVRIVAILARKERDGAFKRLLAGIEDAGLTPVISSPLELMESILERWGWVRTVYEPDSWERREETWRPPSGWKAPR